MIADKELIENICQMYRLKTDEMLVEYILQEYGHEPFPHCWTEQDLFEQIRKLISKYSSGDLSIMIKTREELWRYERTELQDLYIESRKEYAALTDHLDELKRILKDKDIPLPEYQLNF